MTDGTPRALLEVDALRASYGARPVLHGISLAVAEGVIAALIGANGAGKTTTLRAISGMVRTAGEIRFAGARIDGRATEDIARLGIAHVPEGRGTFRDLTVAENLRLGALVRRDRAAARADLDRVYRYFPVLAERRGQRAGALSGGEQQMLALSRALMMRPRLLLLDEPSFGLAPLVVRDLFRILREISAEQRLAILLVEQNVDLALALADRAYLLETGRIRRAGSAAEMRADAAVRRSYLGIA